MEEVITALKKGKDQKRKRVESGDQEPYYTLIDEGFGVIDPSNIGITGTYYSESFGELIRSEEKNPIETVVRLFPLHIIEVVGWPLGINRYCSIHTAIEFTIKQLDEVFGLLRNSF